jgi:hypothetical protein
MSSIRLTKASSQLACLWETSARAFLAFVALASASLTAWSAESLATASSLAHFSLASLRALVVALSLDSNELTCTRVLAKETVARRQGKTIQKRRATKTKEKGKAKGLKLCTLGFIGSLMKVKTLSAKRQEFLHQGLKKQRCKQGYCVIF